MTCESVPASGAGMSWNGPMIGQDFAGIAAGEAFLFAERELVGIAHHPALGAAEGEIDQRVLPRLEHGQGHDFVAVDGGIEADTPLERPARVVVLGAVAGEDLDAAIIHAHGAGDDQHPLGRREHLAPDGIEIHGLIDAVEIMMRVLPELGVLGLWTEQIGGGGGGGGHIGIVPHSRAPPIATVSESSYRSF